MEKKAVTRVLQEGQACLSRLEGTGRGPHGHVRPGHIRYICQAAKPDGRREPGPVAMQQRQSLHSVLFLATNRRATAATTGVRRHEPEHPADGLGDGRTASQARENTYNAVSNTTR